VTDDAARTITFHLSAPDPFFLEKTAWIATAPVPPGTPVHPTSANPLPGTGPYMIASANNDEIRYVRNPYFREWSHAAQPDGQPRRDRHALRAHARAGGARSRGTPGRRLGNEGRADHGLGEKRRSHPRDHRRPLHRRRPAAARLPRPRPARAQQVPRRSPATGQDDPADPGRSRKRCHGRFLRRRLLHMVHDPVPLVLRPAARAHDPRSQHARSEKPPRRRHPLGPDRPRVRRPCSLGSHGEHPLGRLVSARVHNYQEDPKVGFVADQAWLR
jgi:hypothetical protein